MKTHTHTHSRRPNSANSFPQVDISINPAGLAPNKDWVQLESHVLLNQSVSLLRVLLSDSRTLSVPKESWWMLCCRFFLYFFYRSYFDQVCEPHKHHRRHYSQQQNEWWMCGRGCVWDSCWKLKLIINVIVHACTKCFVGRRKWNQFNMINVRKKEKTKLLFISQWCSPKPV